MKPDAVALLDATAQADLVRRKEMQPIELVEAAITRIGHLNPLLNAVITPLFDKARAQATAPDLPDGPFRGVPLLLKDFLCHTAGDPYYEGMRFLRDLGWCEQRDTYLAGKFRAAGFVVLGKTNLPELAGPPITEPLAFGPTRNPWDLTHSPGGSSGGSAAAVAAGLVPVAHGNDGYAIAPRPGERVCDWSASSRRAGGHRSAPRAAQDCWAMSWSMSSHARCGMRPLSSTPLRGLCPETSSSPGTGPPL